LQNNLPDHDVELICRDEAFKAFDMDRKPGYQVEMKFTASMDEAVEFITRKWDM
jgi:hypothetical protein